MARAFAKQGATVSLVARSAEAIKELADELEGHAFATDLLDANQTDELIPRIVADAGPVDILVNNAGIDTDCYFNEIDPQTIRDITTLNLEVPMVLTRAVIGSMLRRNRGHLVFVSSLAGSVGFPGLAAYGATKAGLTNFAAALRMELKDTPINTTVVAPGPVDTDMWDHLEHTSDFEPMLARMRALQLIPTKSPESLAKRTVKAVAADRRHVRTPRRLSAMGMLRELPTRTTEAVLSGVPLGPQPEP